MINFKVFLDHAAAGEERHDLCIVADKRLLLEAMTRLMSEATERGLAPVAYPASGRVNIGPTIARFVVAHRHVGQMLSGMQFTSIVVDELPNADDEVRAQINMLKRWSARD